MRICVVMEYHPADLTGGAETQVFGLSREFVKAGHEVCYLCQRYDPAKPVDEVIDGVRVLRALTWHRVFRCVVAWPLVRTVRRVHPDLVYQRFGSPFTGLAALAARSLGVPFVWGSSEDRLLEKGYVEHEPETSIHGPLQALKRALLKLDVRINRRLFYYGLRKARLLVVQNRTQLRLLKKTFGLSGVVIPNGVALWPSRRAPSAQPVVLWLSRIAPRKNVEAFINLAGSLRTEHPDVRFAIVGGRQEDTYLESVRRRAAQVEGLEMVGEVPPGEVEHWFERAWVFVLTSVSEGFPNVLLQSWAAGVPVVSLVVDPDGLIHDHGLGMVSGTADRLRHDVSRLLSDSDLRAGLAAASQAYVAEHLEFEKVAARYLGLFQELAVR